MFFGRHVRRAAEKMGVAGLLAPRPARQPHDQRIFALRQLLEHLFHRRQVGEGLHPLAAGAQFAHGLGTAHQQLTHHRQFGRHQPHLLGQQVAVLGHAAAFPRNHRQLVEAHPVQRPHHILLGQGHDRVAVRFLVAGGRQGIQRQRVVLRCRHLFFDQAAEDTRLHLVQRCFHGISLRQ